MYICTSQQNSVAERNNRTIVEATRTMLDEKYMLKSIGHKLNMAHIRVFGSIAYVHVPKEKKEETQRKSRKVHNS